MHSRCCILPLFLPLCTLLEGARSAKNLLVNIKGQGTVIGKEVTIARNQKGSVFLGIPYAEPPIGNNRFAPPQRKPWPSWTGVRNATEFMPSCMQIHQNFDLNDRLNLATRLFPGRTPEYNEDCLYLNVYVPDAGRSRERGGGWPVAIWFHPGDFNVGSPILWDAAVYSIKQKLIVVTVSYRLNIMGFFTTMDNNAPGNFGLLDQVAAMEWVQDHIEYFNGSKTDVVLWGHSSGAISVTLHLVSELSAGNFHRVIAMSGTFLTHDLIKTPDISVLDDISEDLYCNRQPTEKLMECLRKVEPEHLIKKVSEYGTWGPVIDGAFKNVTQPFLKAHPVELLKEGKINKVPILMGYTDMEDIFTMTPAVSLSAFEETVRSSILQDYKQLLIDNETCTLNDDFLVDSVLFYYTPSITDDPAVYRRKSIDFATEKNYASNVYHFGLRMSKFSPTYLYRFDYKMKTSGISDSRDWVGVPQQFELPLFWGMPYWISLSPQVIWNSIDKKTSDVAMGLFGNFTKYSVPVQNKKAISWDPFTEDHPRIFILGKNFSMTEPDTFDYKALHFWNEYYPKLVYAANMCCNSTNTASYEYPIKFIVFPSILFTTFYLEIIF